MFRLISVNGNSTIDVKIVSRVSTVAGTETNINYQQQTHHSPLRQSDGVFFVNNAGINTGNGTVTAVTSQLDWYDEQTLGLTNSTVYWKSIASLLTITTPLQEVVVTTHSTLWLLMTKEV